MSSVNSISGGKTSAYIYANYPADFNLFSLVCVDDKRCGHRDKKLMQMTNDKLQKYCSHQPEFVGTSEDPIILETIFSLEQKYGREIVFLRGKSLDTIIKDATMLFNKHNRFCTSLSKLETIFQWCYKYLDMGFVKGLNSRVNYARNPVSMRIGYRYDEKHRKKLFTTDYKMPVYRNMEGKKYHRHETFLNWRKGHFPLIDNERANVFTIQTFWKDKNIPFAQDSNCQMCFWKHEQQLRANFDRNRPQMEWAKRMEEQHGKGKYTFHHKYSIAQIEQLGKQLDFLFVGGNYCQSGHCTD